MAMNRTGRGRNELNDENREEGNVERTSVLYIKYGYVPYCHFMLCCMRYLRYDVQNHKL